MTATFCIEAIFVKYCYTTGSGLLWAKLLCSSCSPLGVNLCEMGLLHPRSVHIASEYGNTMRPLFNTVSFLQYTHTRHPVTRQPLPCPCCLLWGNDVTCATCPVLYVVRVIIETVLYRNPRVWYWIGLSISNKCMTYMPTKNCNSSDIECDILEVIPSDVMFLLCQYCSDA